MRKDTVDFMLNRCRLSRILEQPNSEYRAELKDELDEANNILYDMGIWGDLLKRMQSPMGMARNHGVTVEQAQRWIELADKEFTARCNVKGINLKDFDEILDQDRKRKTEPRKEPERKWVTSR